MSGARVVLVITGSIAAYKACEVVRRLRDHGVDIRVAMSRAAAEFVSPLTFAALTGNRVLSDSFDDDEHPERIAHIRWGEDCDVFCVAPASADFIAKMALGLADDFPSTLHLAVEGAVLVAPAMEDQMWLHPAVQANVETLRSRGVGIIEPATGALASGRHGPGRLAEPADIVEAIVEALPGQPAGAVSLDGLRVLVTAGPTHEHFDPVRVFTNPSTGKMGYAIAEQARRAGADVTLVSGPSELADPEGVETVRVVDAEQMHGAVMQRASDADVVVMAAAVSDFRPRERADEKLKKADGEGMTLQMERTPDILAELRAAAHGAIVVGFAAETSDLEKRARDKLESKGCDLIVGNLVGVEGSGFAADTNEVVVFDRLGGSRVVGAAAKSAVAAAIWETVDDFRQRIAASPERAG